MKKRLPIFIFICLLPFLMWGCNKNDGKSAATKYGDYWTSYSNLPGPPDSLTALSVKGPFYVYRVSIGEASTTEILATVEFSKNQTLASETDADYQSKYWIEKAQKADGQTTSVKVSSNVANDFYVTLYFKTVKDDIESYWVQCKSDDGVHSSDGAVIPEPYQDPQLPIAGVKEFNFKGSLKEGNEIKNSLDQAGYVTEFRQYTDGLYTVSGYKKHESRAKIEETQFETKDWNTNKEKSKGNVGFYDKSTAFSGSIIIDWTFSNIPFTIEINDARLDKLEEGEDEISYTMSGTAEIKQTSFSMGDLVFKLKDQQKKNFTSEYGFKIKKEPEPAVIWDYVETWEYVDEKYGTPFLLTVSYVTYDSPTDLSYIPVKALDEIDGTDKMTFMMPAFGGTATWTFKVAE